MMRRYIPRKPTRREIRAALEVYKPYGFDGGKMPEDMTNPEIYKPGKCWWTFKGRKFNTPQHICGDVASLRKVTKHGTNVTNMACISMYLCDTHTTKLKAMGYTVTVVTLPPSQPYGIVKP